MPYSNNWILPDGIQEELPNEAEKLEMLRRNLIDMYQSWGYRLALPPLVEFMDSLRAGSGTLLDLQTIKITDILSGRLMGIRADMTPQVARIDAHRLKTDGINRLCYYGRVLRTKSTHPSGSRSPLQVGAELFGHSGIDSDYEIINLMIETLKTCKIENIILDIGHVQIFRGLAQQAKFTESDEKLFFDMLQRKSIPEIQTWLDEKTIDDDIKAMLLTLPTLNGTTDLIEKAKVVLAKASADVQKALNYLAELITRIQTKWPDVKLHIDLSELRGYTYHNGIVYAAYTQETGRELARGGRYDDIGERFGNARPATGFSSNLCQLAELGNITVTEHAPIHAPASDDPQLTQLITELRNQGKVVIQAFQGQKETTDSDQIIQMQDGKWVLK
jgi:ATP phosphoribosyltransferase regulatory subunit